MTSLVIAKGCYGVNKLHVLKRARTGIAPKLVVFFFGDQIQQAGVDPVVVQWQKPDHICNTLASKFGSQVDIALVVPSRVEACCACYDHFFDKLTLTGEPVHGYGRSWKASNQLFSLLCDAGLLPGKDYHDGASSLQLPEIEIVGFSKGGILVNELLAQLAAFTALSVESSSTTCIARPLLQRLCRFHYLDAGLNCRGAYLTDPEAWLALGQWIGAKRQSNGPLVIIHGTPRQWNDPRRPFLVEEKDRLLKLAEAYGVPVTVRKYFQGEKPSLSMHFRIIEAANFCP